MAVPFPSVPGEPSTPDQASTRSKPGSGGAAAEVANAAVGRLAIPRCWRRGILPLALSWGLLATTAWAQPVVQRIQPRSCCPGETTTLQIDGAGLSDTLRALASHPNISVSVQAASGKQATVQLSVPTDAPLGPMPLWFADAAGPAEPVVVIIDDLPTLVAPADNTSRQTAQPLPLPGAVDGVSQGAHSAFYRIEVAAGERVAIEVLTQPLDSPMDPLVRLLDAQGRTLAFGDDDEIGPDCRFAHRFEQAGSYWIEVRDNGYVAGGSYRLRVGDFPILRHAWPLAITAGEPSPLRFVGPDGAAAQPQTVTADAVQADSLLAVATRFPTGRSSSWVPVQVTAQRTIATSHPEPLATGTPKVEQDIAVAAPAVISGHLAAPGGRSEHAIAGREGTTVRFRARARSLRCATLPTMRLLPPGPASASAAAVAETQVNDTDEWSFDYTFPHTGTYRLEVTDLLGRGGDGLGYTVELLPAGSFSLQVKPAATTALGFALEPEGGAAALDIQVERFGNSGAIDLSLVGNPPGLRLVNPHIPADAKEARVYLVADTNWTAQSSAVVELQGTASAGSSPTARVGQLAWRRAKQPHVPFPLHGDRGQILLSGVAASEPLFRISPEAPLTFTPSLTEHTASLVLTRTSDAFKGDVLLLPDALPPGWSAAIQPAGDRYNVTWTRTAEETSQPPQLRLLAFAQHGKRGRMETLELTPQWQEPPEAEASEPPANTDVSADARRLDDASVLVRHVADPAPQELEVYPAAIDLVGNRDRRQLVVTGYDAALLPRDLTAEAQLTSAAPEIAEVRGSTVFAKSDGQTQIIVEAAGQRRAIPVHVSATEQPWQTRFESEVLVALSKQGCNAGACHGSPSGKGKFRLSLRAFDAELDALTLIREDYGRRINRVAPEQSLLLLKPLMKVTHGSGRQLRPEDEAYAILHNWIAQGAQPDPAGTPRCVRLEVYPGSKRVLPLAAGTQQFAAVAHFSDGTQRDVTHLVAYESSNAAVAEVDPDGRVTPKKRGEAVILVRFLEHIESVPLMFTQEVVGFAWDAPAPHNYVDELVDAKLKQLQYVPAALCSDAEFLRRVHLDVVGSLPTLDTTRQFLADTSADKRRRLIDELLQRDEFAKFWALKWGDLLKMTTDRLGVAAVHKYHRWIEEAFRNNLPYDEFARQLLTSSGSTLANPPANFYRAAADMNEAVENVSQVFLGVRLQCAKCHNHPFERWTQDDYYGLATFFQRVQRRKTQRPGETFIWTSTTGEVRQPRTGELMQPWLPGRGRFEIEDAVDRREIFAQWLIDPANPYFASMEVNRIWAQLFARGIVDPIDDFRDSNPPSNDALLDALTEDFVQNGFDRRHILRVILNSRTYQSSFETTPLNAEDSHYFSHQQPRMLGAEPLLDAINQAIGLEQTFANLPPGTKASHLPAPDLIKVDFLKTFGQPERSTVCDCERVEGSSLARAIEMFNGPTLHEKLQSPQARFRTSLASGQSVTEVVEQMYLAALCRYPSKEELAASLQHCEQQPDVEQGLEDVLWALLNSDEFLFQH